MSGFFKKTLSFFGLADEEELEIEDDERMAMRDRKDLSEGRSISHERSAQKRLPRKKVSLINSAREAKKARVFIAKPEEFEGIQIIADNFKNDIPVIVNLQQADQDVSKRIIDFCSGLTYALEGDIKKVADRVFLITPSNIEVNSKESDFLGEEGFLKPF
ncbi:MAG: cell division protein SepF [Actinomycetia bacterium]|nr:cell division protein SepF [Actinomycetes bacterium]